MLAGVVVGLGEAGMAIVTSPVTLLDDIIERGVEEGAGGAAMRVLEIPRDAKEGLVGIVHGIDELITGKDAYGNDLPAGSRVYRGVKAVVEALATAAGLKGVGRGRSGAAACADDAPPTATITDLDRLQAHAVEAARRADAKGLSRKQKDAVSQNPNLEKAYRGSNIHAELELIDADGALNHLEQTPRFKRGPDVIDPATGRWYDLTTPGQWGAHVRRYASFGEGTPIWYPPQK